MLPKSLTELLLMLNLYGSKRVTLNNLAIMAGVRKNGTWLYKLRNRLIKEGFLKESGMIRNGRPVKCYNVNHSRLDDFFTCEFPTRHIYERTHNGPISTFPRLKKADDEKLMRWVGKV